MKLNKALEFMHLEFFTLYEWHPTDEIVFLERTADKPRNDYCHRSQPARQRNGRPARRNQNLIFFMVGLLDQIGWLSWASLSMRRWWMGWASTEQKFGTAQLVSDNLDS